MAPPILSSFRFVPIEIVFILLLYDLMASSAASKAPKRFFPRLTLSPKQGHEIVGVVLATLVLLLAGSLLSYRPQDPSVLNHVADGSVSNLMGPVGANVSAIAFALLGLTALLLPFPLGLSAYRKLWRRGGDESVPARWIGTVLMLIALPGLLELLIGTISWRHAPLHAGGLVGLLCAGTDEGFLVGALSFGGSFVVLLAVLVVGATLAFQSSLGDSLAVVRGQLDRLGAWFALQQAQRRERRSKARTRERVVSHRLAQTTSRTTGSSTSVLEESDQDLPAVELPPVRVRTRQGEGQFSVRKVSMPRIGGTTQQGAPAPPSLAAASASSKPAARATKRKHEGPSDTAPTVKAARTQQDLGFTPSELQPSELPPLNLLDLSEGAVTRDEGQLVRRGERIEQACSEFGVEGTIQGIGPGPVITVYEMQPAPGVKVSRIVNLQDDLALALKAESVRIDRIPGRSTLGLEVPNRRRSTIHLGRLLAAEPFAKAPSVLTMALGADIHGKPYYSDLATMPHLLVAGATGAGKSVGLQSMITSILYRATREQVQFIFIDPKRIELGVYADIPHLKTEVVVEPKKAANALRWAVSEMERRYRLLAEVHVRSIAFYNQAIRDPKARERLALNDGEVEVRAEDLKPLPYYVIVIDELADLMMVSSSDVETSIARLAQMARAVGIHLIVATQRPSVDVLTGTIKANFPCRLAYATATRHDSRTILDQIGAEKLLGRGDALLMPPGTSRIMRLHGAYISEQETASLIRWLKRQGKPELDLDVLKDPDDGKSSEGGGSGGGADDALYDEAARLVVAERMASASFLQRRMRVGFSRAARLVDMMEADGLLGPAQGSKPRDVLVPPDYFDEIERAQEGV